MHVSWYGYFERELKIIRYGICQLGHLVLVSDFIHILHSCYLDLKAWWNHFILLYLNHMMLSCSLIVLRMGINMLNKSSIMHSFFMHEVLFLSFSHTEIFLLQCVGRDGLTHNMLELIHAHWKRQRVCKVRCRGVPTVDMNNVCRHLEVSSTT